MHGERCFVAMALYKFFLYFWESILPDPWGTLLTVMSSSRIVISSPNLHTSRSEDKTTRKAAANYTAKEVIVREGQASQKRINMISINHGFNYEGDTCHNSLSTMKGSGHI